ncbi:uroporphyrinogen-III C-methyltransferase [Inmirania thermothiophila]|uniref:Uroporphyrin-3 C-methyltransferase n=1 Tax=Inmirania thermothiophila TaxID=1750597 RepID=A0A3N1Y6F2_9GAMM|nr:uroporphyrinogen-III C-methyltransferase [Inmirania thermothiophila]ROR34394.1 uroporphyrin-3 C-methyltransferase [Inmirania thermothiophila]
MNDEERRQDQDRSPGTDAPDDTGPQGPEADGSAEGAGGEAAPAPAAEEGAGPRARRIALLALVVALFALAAALAAGAGAYLLWRQATVAVAETRAAARGGQERLAATLAKLDERVAQLAAGLDAARAEDAALGQRLQALRESVAELAARERGRDNAWLVAEAEYLLRVANHRLRLAGDRAAALAALRAADGRLREAADPRLIEVREAVAREIAALEAVAVPDLAGLAARISALEGLVPRLPVRGVRPPLRPAAGDGAADRPPVRDLGGFLRAVWADVRDLVRIRRDAEAAEPLLPPDAAYFLRENLRLKLEGARLALLRGDEAAYRELLRTARAWLERHFVADDTAVAAALGELEGLAAAPVRPAWPDISGSLRLLTAQRAAGG